MRELEASLKDLDAAQLYIQKSAACLFNLILYDEGGDDIKFLRRALLAMRKRCRDIQSIWEAERT